MNKLIPQPKKITPANETIALAGVNVVSAANEKTAKTAASLLSKLGAGDYRVEMKYKEVCGGRADAYTLAITAQGAVIAANDAGGLLYGAQTMVSLAESDNGGFVLPCVQVEDYPDFTDRGLMLENRYGSDFMTLNDYKKAVDYLSEMKYNQLTVGIYGCWCVQYDMRLSEFLYIPLKNHPELKTPRDIRYYSPEKKDFVIREDVLPEIFEKDYFGELIEYASSRNIKIKPLFNSFGHNTLIPRLHPELSAKDENGNPTGHGFCVSDDAVYDFMFSIYDEIIDRYLAPNGIDAIEIGLDEVYAWLGEDLDDVYGKFEPYCRCEKCRSMEKKELMLHYIIRVVKYLKSRGMKNVYIYHDMLFEIFDIVNDELVELFKKEGIYDTVVLDWWSYTKKEDLFGGRTVNGLFRSIAKPFTGYYHWVVPMEYNSNIAAHAALARENGFEGIESYSSFEYCFDRPFMYQAELSWNAPDGSESYEEFCRRYAENRFPGEDGAEDALRLAGELTVNDTSVNLTNSLEYYWFTYVAADEPYPREFNAAVFKKIIADKEKYIPYFEKTLSTATEALEFFEKSGSKQYGAIWALICDHYRTMTGYYTSMLDLYDNHKNDREYIIRALTEQKNALERFMARIERTRMAANSYVYLRNISITRQLVCDALAALEDGCGIPFDITSFDWCISETYRALR